MLKHCPFPRTKVSVYLYVAHAQIPFLEFKVIVLKISFFSLSRSKVDKVLMYEQ